MHRLLTKQLFRGARVSSKFIQAKGKYEESLYKATEEYQQNSLYINNSHILIRLLGGLVFEYGTSDEYLYRAMNNQRERIFSGLGITTDLNPGNIFKKAFYTSHCVIMDCSFSDPMNIPHWKHIRAVRVLTHPHETLNLVLPHRLKSIYETDYSVVGIDLPLLAVQYHNWLQEQHTKPPHERDTIAMFVYKWVLSGMLPEQIDIALRNRVLAMVTGNYREEPDLKNYFFVQQYDEEFDKALRELISWIRTGRRTVSEVMKNIPMFSIDSYWEAVPRQLDSLSLYSYWTHLLVYCDWFYPLAVGFDIDGTQETVARKLKTVKRYVDGTLTDKFIKGPVEELWRQKYDTIMNSWINQ